MSSDKKADKKPDKKADKDKENAKKDPFSPGTFTGLALRGIGPAVASGRVIDVAVNPRDKATYYVAAASGGVWKTINSGTTFEPVFDGEASFSIGCVTLDPQNPLVVWVGTGEKNSQRSVSYGDGVYKSVDGGKSWENVGLKRSEHIGKVLVDPRSSNTVYVAAQGPLWAPGGDRGLYKTTDGGKSWKQILAISENTGVTDVVFDPRNPDVLYAAAYQRRRHVWTLIDGGPESALYKSADAGATWKKLEGGLPKGDVGRIGIAISAANPDVLYATIEGSGRSGSGFYRSEDAGATWEKRSGTIASSPQYYQMLFLDPRNADRVYLVDLWIRVSDDGGKSFRPLGEKYKHVDNHVLWIDPDNTSHMLAGCDGGLYETYDRAATWSFKANLPITQFYRVDVDYDTPFYHVYGGTQDNASFGGPSRTNTIHGIANSDWFVTVGGDGFVSKSDPEDPNIVYAESQYGGLVRHDRKSGESLYIQPQSAPGEPPLRFNWDSPLIISPHAHTRLYFGANRLFRSDDRGGRWRAVSPDLTRQLDRNKLKVMGKVWSIDAVAKNTSTSFYGNIVALAESPQKEGLLYIGTDDGLIQVSEDGGGRWRKIERFPGVPENAYVSRLETSRQDVNTVYAAFDNHKVGDFKPYLLKSTDRGATWTSIAGNLPARGSVYAVVEDHVDRNLLFAGTEFGLFFSLDGGKKWIQMKGGMPTIAVRDLVIQRRENDLALATFGRGFYILDDYSPLRLIKPETLEQEAVFFPIKAAPLYIEAFPLGGPGKAFLGDSYYLAPNPPFGAVFTYYLKEDIETLKKKRQEAEKKLEKSGGTLTYPSWDALKTESREIEPTILFTITDEEGNVIRRGTGPASAGIHRVYWDLRYPSALPAELEPSERDQFAEPRRGPIVVPGRYRVAMAKRVQGVVTPLGEQAVTVNPLETGSLKPADRAALLAFQRKAVRLQRAVAGAIRAAEETAERLNYIQHALPDTLRNDPQLVAQAVALDNRLKDLNVKLTGDPILGAHSEPAAPSIVEYVERGLSLGTSVAPTGTQEEAYTYAAQSFAPVLKDLRQLIEVDLRKLEEQLEIAGAPWTPGRVPTWTPE